MRRGRHLEPAIAAWWADELGVTLYEPVHVYAARSLLATLDRRVEGDDAERSRSRRHGTSSNLGCRSVRGGGNAKRTRLLHRARLCSPRRGRPTMRLQTITVYPDRDAISELHHRAKAVMVHVNAGRWPPHVPGRYLQLPGPPAAHSKHHHSLSTA